MRRPAAILATVAAAALAGCGGGHAHHYAADQAVKVHVSTSTTAAGATAFGLKPTHGSMTLYLAGGRLHSPAFVAGATNQTAIRRESRATRAPLFRAAAPQWRGYDSVTAGNVPLHATVAGCYASGSFVNCAAMLARAPAHILSIATWTGAKADCADVEPGDLTPAQTPAYWHFDFGFSQRLGKPCFYASASAIGTVESYLSHAGIARSRYYVWVARWNGHSALYAGEDMAQWASNALVDTDTVGSWTYGASKPAPKPKPKPPPPPRPVMHLDRFCHNPGDHGLGCGPYSVPFSETKAEHGDSNNERAIIGAYVTARAKSQTGKRVRYVAELKEEARGLAIRLVGVMASSPKTKTEFFREGRAACLEAAAHNLKFDSWNGCASFHYNETAHLAR